MNANACQLLDEYARNQCEAAFRELVSRYIDLVYSTALRLTDGDSHLAEDVAQVVFIDLARKAGGISSDVMLGGWLHRRTCHVTATMLRGQRRRQARERQAMEMNAVNSHSQANLERLGPALDEAINQLGLRDRTAILLRFFEQRDFRSLGQALGVTEDAARMRVSRALDKLHSLLARKDATLSVAALSAALAGGVVYAAPAGLASSLAGSALANAAAGTTAWTFLKIMSMTKLKIGVIGAVATTGLATTLALQHQSQARLQQENASLRQQTAQLGQVAAEHERLSNLLAQATTSREFSPAQDAELLKLRGEVGRLRRELQESQKLRQQNQPLRAAAAPTFTPAGPTNDPQRLYLRIMPLEPEHLAQLLHATPGPDGESNSEKLKRYLAARGMEMAPPASVSLDERRGALLVQATMDEQSKLLRLLTNSLGFSSAQCTSAPNGR